MGTETPPSSIDISVSTTLDVHSHTIIMFASSWTEAFFAVSMVVALVLRWRKHRANFKDRLLSLSYAVSWLAERDGGPLLSKKLDDIAKTLAELLKDDRRRRYMNSP